VDDLADACVFLIERGFDGPLINQHQHRLRRDDPGARGNRDAGGGL
jgi:hypothetical protein